MKKLLITLEDLWVAVAFAEAGEYESLHNETEKVQLRYSATDRMRAL